MESYVAHAMHKWRIASIILDIDIEKDELALLPLIEKETPLDVLSDNTRKEYYKDVIHEFQSNSKNINVSVVSLSRAVSEKRLGPPIPVPEHIFAVAANYPSHLKYDLGIKDAEQYRNVLSNSRPRIFLKYPLVVPHEAEKAIKTCKKMHQIIGPYDDAYYRKYIAVPASSKISSVELVSAHIDYEAEIGAVMGKDLTWDDIKHASDEEILKTVSGYVLVNDTKARNPQVMLNILRHEEKPIKQNPYRIGNKLLDRRLGIWDQQAAMWWSYAASWGGVHSIGPVFVEAVNDGLFPERAVIGARSFGSNRPSETPKLLQNDLLYLRQLSFTTRVKNATDGIIWGIPEIVRSILQPNNALEFYAKPINIKQGDIISLGTPGGTVISVKRPNLFRIVEDIALWMKPIEWHGLFFKKDAKLYLEENDTIFIWATRLGFQQITLKEMEKNKITCEEL